MTHKDIYVKFMIEYDKANITSSYPSLTKYEIATILDKAYLALIAQKFTGNNQRKVGFEADIKAIEDLKPLIVTETKTEVNQYEQASNDHVYSLVMDNESLYYVNSKLVRNISKINSIDGLTHSVEPILILDHNSATKFMATDYNLPWIKNPVAFAEGDYLHVLVDSYKLKDDLSDDLNITYIKKPNMFVCTESTNGYFTLDVSQMDSEDVIE